jgi:hypothetical protein
LIRDTLNEYANLLRQQLGGKVLHSELQRATILALLEIDGVNTDQSARAILGYLFGVTHEKELDVAGCKTILVYWLGSTATGYTIADEVISQAKEILEQVDRSKYSTSLVTRIQFGDTIYPPKWPKRETTPFQAWLRTVNYNDVVEQLPFSPTSSYETMVLKGYVIPEINKVHPKSRGRSKVKLEQQND